MNFFFWLLGIKKMEVIPVSRSRVEQEVYEESINMFWVYNNNDIDKKT